MSSLFGRFYRLTITLSGGDKLVYEPPMQVQFTVYVYPSNAGGTSQITLFGASSETRQRIYQEFDSIALSAGYQDRYGLIFKGDIINVEIGREGPDVYVRFYCRSNGKHQLESYVNESWGPNTPQQQIIRDVAERLLMPVEFIGDFSGLPRAMKERVISAPTVEAMNELARIHKFDWLIDRGRVLIIKRGASRDTPSHLISASTGMVGSPQILIQGVDVATKLNSQIVPGDRVDVQAETRNFSFSGVYTTPNPDRAGGQGIYRVLMLRHEGDYYGDQWDTTIRGQR